MTSSGYQARAPKRPKKRKKKVYTPDACPVCGHLTFAVETRGDYFICPVCFWEDEFVPEGDLDYPTMSNQGLTINLARKNFAKYGAAHPDWVEHVRDPLSEEIPPK